MANILVLHGPNLNLLGQREPDLYGTTNLDEINQALKQQARLLNHTLDIQQKNAEHELIQLIHNCASSDPEPSKSIDLILFNPAAFTHTSVALRDALLGVNIPFIEVHLSNIYQREPFRHTSYFSDIAIGVISGFGAQSYYFALTAADNYLKKMQIRTK